MSCPCRNPPPPHSYFPLSHGKVHLPWVCGELIPVQRLHEEGAVLQPCCWRQALLRPLDWNILRRSFFSKSWGTSCCCFHPCQHKPLNQETQNNMVMTLLTSEHYSIKLWESWTRRAGGKTQSAPLPHLRSCCLLRKCTLSPLSCSLLSSSWGSFPLPKAVLSAHPPLRQETRLAEVLSSFCSILQSERHLQCCKRLQWWELTSCLKVLQKS